MKINPIFKVRDVAGEHVLLLPGDNGGDMSKVVAFNESAFLLWNTLMGQDFQHEDAAHVLLEYYDVDEATAKADATKWIKVLESNCLLLSE